MNQINLRGSSRSIEPEGNGDTWSAIPSPTFVGALPLQSVTGAFDIGHQWIGLAEPLAVPVEEEPGDTDESRAILADHPDVLQRLARLRASGPKGRPLSEVAAELGIDD